MTKDAAMSRVLTAIANGQAGAAAEWKRTVDQMRRDTAVIVWASATFLGTVVSGAFGVLLVSAIGFRGMPAQVDMLVTGLAIGSERSRVTGAFMPAPVRSARASRTGRRARCDSGSSHGPATMRPVTSIVPELEWISAPFAVASPSTVPPSGK